MLPLRRADARDPEDTGRPIDGSPLSWRSSDAMDHLRCRSVLVWSNRMASV